MATADEKDAKQAARDVARQSIVQGQQRLATIAQAGSAYPTRRLRSSGDLSRYAIGGFLSDALPPISTGGGTKPPANKPPSGKPSATKGKTTTTRYGGPAGHLGGTTTTRYGGPAGHLGGTTPKKPIVASTGGGARSKTL